MSIDLKDVRDRLRALGLFNSVSDWLSGQDAIENANAHPPAAFVSTASERAAPNRLSTGRHRQLVVQTISVLFCLPTERADEERSDELEAHRLAVQEELTGLRPIGADSPFDYVGFSIRFAGEGLVWGELLFSAPYTLSREA